MSQTPQSSTFVSQLSELHAAASQPHIHGGSKYLTCKACKALHELEDFLPPRAGAILALVEAAEGVKDRWKGSLGWDRQGSLHNLISALDALDG